MKIILILFVWYINVQDSELYPEPLYYEVNFNDGVTHLWSREVHDDIYGIRFKTAVNANKRFKGLTHYEIEYNTILETRSRNSEEIKKKAGIIE